MRAQSRATPRLIQCSWDSEDGISTAKTKFVEWPVVERVPESKVIVIVISKLLKRHSRAKRRAPAYSRALHHTCIRGVVERIVRGRLRSGFQRVRAGRLGVKAGVV